MDTARHPDPRVATQNLKKRLAELQREEAVRRHELASLRDRQGRNEGEARDLEAAMAQCRKHIKAMESSQRQFNHQCEESKADLDSLKRAAEQAKYDRSMAEAASKLATRCGARNFSSAWYFERGSTRWGAKTAAHTGCPLTSAAACLAALNASRVRASWLTSPRDVAS